MYQDKLGLYIDGLVQERCHSSVLAMELRLSYLSYRSPHRNSKADKLCLSIKMDLPIWNMFRFV